MGIKRLIMLALLISLVLVVIGAGGCTSAETGIPVQIIEDITPREAFTLIQENRNNPDFVIIDVRTPQEFTGGHIDNAINIDFYAETFRDELNDLDKSQTYLVYCRSGVRSRNALNTMEELNFQEGYNMLGGILAWKADGLPTVK